MGMVQHTDQINNRVGERVLPGEEGAGCGRVGAGVGLRAVA
jgi:hypothetical protein